jgi:hypothetical protein
MGAILIVGALLLPKEQTVDAENGIIVTQAPPRTEIDVQDEDGDGTPDWQELLTARIVDSIELPPKGTKPEDYEGDPSTFTAKFSQSFVSDYLENKTSNDPLANPDALIDGALRSIEDGTRSKTYTVADLTVVPDSADVIRDYGNAIAQIMISKPSSGDLEIAITSDALKLNDPTQLERLKPAKQNYKSMVLETLDVPVPTSYTKLHLDLINSYEAAYTDIVAMEQAFTDPLYALSRFKGHYDDLSGMFRVIKSIQIKLVADGITYDESEPGAYLYVFKL